jgi:hypothetical protein
VFQEFSPRHNGGAKHSTGTAPILATARPPTRAELKTGAREKHRSALPCGVVSPAITP